MTAKKLRLKKLEDQTSKSLAKLPKKIAKIEFLSLEKRGWWWCFSTKNLYGLKEKIKHIKSIRISKDFTKEEVNMVLNGFFDFLYDHSYSLYGEVHLHLIYESLSFSVSESNSCFQIEKEERNSVVHFLYRGGKND